MESFGRAIVIPERLMDAASAAAGSLPAFVFMFIEALAERGRGRWDAARPKLVVSPPPPWPVRPSSFWKRDGIPAT